MYRERLAAFTVGHTITAFRVLNPFVLRTVTPAPSVFELTVVEAIETIGKRLVFACEHDRYIVVHLMIAGRLRWRPPGKKLPGKLAIAALTFAHGTLFLTEAGSKKRASIHLVDGAASLQAFHRGGIDPLSATAQTFAESLRRENHTIKRALTDPRIVSGIGNAYSDEILHAARLSPMRLTSAMSDAECERVRQATIRTLTVWTDRLRAQAGDGFPESVTAFHPEMAVHGRFGLPCPDCGSPVQRIRYATTETNYCAACQNNGRILADRALSRLLKREFPRTLESLDE